MENKIVKFTLEYRLCSVILDGNHVSKGRFWMTHLFQHFDLTDFFSSKINKLFPLWFKDNFFLQSLWKKLSLTNKKNSSNCSSRKTHAVVFDSKNHWVVQCASKLGVATFLWYLSWFSLLVQSLCSTNVHCLCAAKLGPHMK